MMNQSKRERRQNRDQEGRENVIDFGTSNDYWSWRAQESAVHYLNPNQSAPQQPCSTNFRCYGTSNQPQEPRSASYRKKNSTRTGVHIEQRPHSDQNGVHQSPRPTQGEKIPNDPNQRNECRLPHQKTQNNVSVIASQQTSNAHLIVLKSIFDKIIIKQFLSKTSIEVGLRIYNQLRDIIISKKPDAQVALYGSFYFACCSNDSPMIDVDVTVNKLLPYNTITEVFEIIRNSGAYQEMRLNTDYDPLCIDLIVRKTNIRIRVTSDNKRSIFSSEIVRLYTRFDPRVLPLLRLIRFFAKICSLDRPDLGTLHPIVFHLMFIHFLQQIEEPVLPCLHEYAIKFSMNQFIISIQTRMPLQKDQKQKLNGNLFCADPMFIDRNLGYTIKSNSSFRYFRRIFEQTLIYFCQKDSTESAQNNAIMKDVHRSCKSLFATILHKVPRRASCTQDDLRQAYKHTFDNRMEALPEPKLVPNENNLLSIMDETAEDTDDLEETYQDDIDTDCEQPISFELLVEHLNEEQKHIVKLEYQRQVHEFNQKMREIVNGLPPLVDNAANKSQPEQLPKDLLVSTNQQPIQLERIIATNVLSYLEAISFDDHADVFQVFQEKNFGARTGPPKVCIECFQSNHVKSQCPLLCLPGMIDLPEIDKKWANALSLLCQQISEQGKLTRESIKTHENIINYLEIEFRKMYPSCRMQGYGSFYNGFDFHQSDLDVCVLLELNKHETNIQVLKNLAQSVKLNKKMFKNVVPILTARIPIIKAKYSQSGTEIDISLNNILPLENTRLLKTYSNIDPRVRELGVMVKYFAKRLTIAGFFGASGPRVGYDRIVSDFNPTDPKPGIRQNLLVLVGFHKFNIGDASHGTLSSYAYTIMVIHFLQQIQPPVVPVLQQLRDPKSIESPITQTCVGWNVYFYNDLTKLSKLWNNYGLNKLSSGDLWIEFLRYYTERFDYNKNIVTIRQFKPLLRRENGWLRPTIAIEDPFMLTHNLAAKLSVKNWTKILRVFIFARQRFYSQPESIDFNISKPNMKTLQKYLFDQQPLYQNTNIKPKKINPVIDNRKRQGRNKSNRETQKKRNPSLMEVIPTNGDDGNLSTQKQEVNFSGHSMNRTFVNRKTRVA
ncbi:unnamed protein product [Rotaria socialis]|uniref:Uncharacterized protein n=1 Tax=Rotaria socialis TaxID=392032 RepID=A0A821BS39_9BILA|nr:unnamed protein product [Rotaria socialis]